MQMINQDVVGGWGGSPHQSYNAHTTRGSSSEESTDGSPCKSQDKTPTKKHHQHALEKSGSESDSTLRLKRPLVNATEHSLDTSTKPVKRNQTAACLISML